MEENSLEEVDLKVEVIEESDEIKFGTSAEILKLDLELAYCGDVNIREVTISELQEAFKNGRITAENLTACYLERIEALNPYLNAVIEVNPDAILIAKELDIERKKSGIRSALHGIPILIKANIGTNDQMETCAGSLALVGLKPKEDSEVVKKLRKAGAIILGKANLSEFANFRGQNIPSGWSGRGKQTKNAYVLSKDPSGSSSGSVVAVAANLCVVSLGTETDGSIISPSSAGSVVGLKPTVGLVSGIGVIPLSVSQDSVGPIARTVKDAAILFNLIAKTPLETKCFDIVNPDFKSCLIANLKVGVLRFALWTFIADDSQLPELEKTLDVLKISGINVQDPIEVEEEILESVSAENERATFYCEFKTGINEYLATKVGLAQEHSRECNKISCLSDIIEFNKKHPVSENYNQEELEQAESTEGIADPTYVEKRDNNIKAARKLIDDLLTKYSLDAIVAPTDSRASFYAAVSGYPIISVPAGIGTDGVPFGIAFFGTANSEEKLLLIAARLETVFRPRRTPLFLR